MTPAPHGGRAPAGTVPSAFRAPRWLAGPHLQTIWASLVAPKPRVEYRRTRWHTPDGDFIDVDLAGPEDPAAPLVVLFHGLEGGSGSHYARALMAEVVRIGWRGAVPHFRGCSGEPNLQPRAYHSGVSDEADWILRRFSVEHARGAPLFAAGVSLGANVLLKWLGERGDDARFVAAAAGVSAPQDLHAGAVALSAGFNHVYMKHFLWTLRRKSLATLDRHPGLYDRARVLAARDFFDFDDAVTAPLHGFASCWDYWRRSSCKQFLPGIRVPTLVINALDDPFLPAHALATPSEVSSSVALEYPARGGHVGFVSGAPPGRLDWLPRRLLAAFSEGIGTRPGAPASPREPHGG